MCLPNAHRHVTNVHVGGRPLVLRAALGFSPRQLIFNLCAQVGGRFAPQMQRSYSTLTRRHSDPRLGSRGADMELGANGDARARVRAPRTR